LYVTNESIKNHILYGQPLDETMNNLLDSNGLVSNRDQIYNEWNYALLFKGYILWIQEIKRTEYTIEFDYMFLNFCLKNQLQNADNEIWRKFYSLFYKLFIKDLKDPTKCPFLLKVLEKFLFFDVIQKPILEVSFII